VIVAPLTAVDAAIVAAGDEFARRFAAIVMERSAVG
jgi:hypothetical protein